MASGIPSATPAVPRAPVRVAPCVPVPAVPRAPVKVALPEAWRTQASPLVMPEFPMARGTPLADPVLARQEARPVSPAEPPVRRRASAGLVMVGVVMVGGAVGAAVGAGAVVGAGATAGAAAGGGVVVGVGTVVGVGASEGRIGDLAGGSAGILGSTIPIGTPPRRHTTPTIRIMARIMTGQTIRLPTVPIRTTLTRRETRTRPARPTTMSAVARAYELIMERPAPCAFSG